MPDMLATGVSGLLAMQRALDVTSHNIANASTPGYSRQRVDLAAMEPQGAASGFVGRGVEIKSVQRAWDAMLVSQARTASSSYTRLETFASKAEALDRLFADAGTGLDATLQRFMDSVQGVANQPTSTAARQVMLGEAEGLQQRLASYDRRLREINAEVDAQLKDEALAVSGLAADIAALNRQIVTAQNTTGQPPNDLLDARDRKIDDLAQRVGVSTVRNADGSTDVFIGTGQPLVLGAEASQLVAQRDPFDPTRSELVFQRGSVTSDLGGALTGGSIGGLLDFRRELLEPVRNQLGQMAVVTGDLVNGQLQRGVDLRGQPGGALFSLGAVAVLPAVSNGGSAQLAVTRTDSSALTADDYILQNDGTGWSLRRAATGEPVAMSGSGTAADPFQVEGLSIAVSGAASAGDRFKLQPTAAAVQDMAVLLRDPATIAAAAPLRSASAAGNTGTASVTLGEVLDAGTPQLTAPATIAFTSATTYTINGSGSYTLGSDGRIEANGWRLEVSGTPAAGDQFTVGPNTGGVGDNRNMLQLAQVLDRGALTGGTESVNQAVTRFMGAIGVATRQARAGVEAQLIMRDDTAAAVDSVSGVNLDEEAANLLRFQQAYQAAAQVIKATQAMFDSLMQATGR
ncbi:MAG: hypothetical protein RL026_2168 [Pseudomonadota bacterium]|jgi:flagellar hook-associated protein 1 FlgK